MSELLYWLQKWYSTMCDGVWEHQNGISISTLDNPGWEVSIEIKKEIYGLFSTDTIAIENNRDDWFTCEVKDSVFIGRGGPKNLFTMLSLFRDIIENRKIA